MAVQPRDVAVQTEPTYEREALVLFGASTGVLYGELLQMTRLSISALRALAQAESHIAQHRQHANELGNRFQGYTDEVTSQYRQQADILETTYQRHSDELAAQHRQEADALRTRYHQWADALEGKHNAELISMRNSYQRMQEERDALRDACPQRTIARVTHWINRAGDLIRANRGRIVDGLLFAGAATTAYLAWQADS